MATSAGNLKSATQVLGRIAGYELLEQVGRGGMGVVFRARDPSLDKIVAIKILPDERARDAEYRARFLREARTEASIDHPLIACCFSIGEADLDPPDLIPSATQEPPLPRKLYLTMEFIPGSDLSALVHGEPLAIERVLDLAGQIAEGLEVAHAAGVVHRDIKPANVRVTPDGRVKLLDFGLAAIIPKPNSKTDSFKSSIDRKMGTCHFMSPEQTNGRTIDPRTDLFSLGVVLYLLVTGRLPFTGETPYEVEDAIRHTEPPPMARYANGVSAELERITKKLLAKDASNRYQSAHEVHTDLVLLGKGPIAPEPESFAHRALLIAFGAVLVLIAAWAIWRIFVRPPWHALAVVPFVNRTGDPRLDYLGDGIAANLIGSLFRGSRLSVAAASTVQKIVPSERTARNLKHELGVDATLTGSLSRRDELLHLDLELVEGGHGFVIWAASYDYDLAAIDDTERQITCDVVRRLTGPSAGHVPQNTPKFRSRSAYDAVLRAWSALDDPDAKAPDRALAHVTQALELDPDFALAWA
ncbi:MAG TPA: serine/threonine-protein kinase, partial [Verrucomicrobiae bacterium]|nr:serine/threonine-protein kinase [Verrucomicrobiae bacterium]